MENQKGVMLGREQLMAVDFAATDYSRGGPGLAAVHVKADGTTEASNGHFAIRVPGAETPAEDFPAVEGMGAGFNGAGLNVPAQTIKDTIKSLPKRSTIPILAMAHLGSSPDGGTITTTDLETAAPRRFKSADTKFPDLDLVIPGPDDAHGIVVGFNAHYLKTIAEYAIKVAANPKGTVVLKITLDRKEPGNNPGRFVVELPNERQAVVALMPCRTT